jgi:hypothetical protein
MSKSEIIKFQLVHTNPYFLISKVHSENRYIYCLKLSYECFHNQIVNLNQVPIEKYKNICFINKELKRDHGYYEIQKNVTKMIHSFMHLLMIRNL